jgi:hypothetical protein
MSTHQRAAVNEYQALLPAAPNAASSQSPVHGDGCQSRLDKIEFLIGVYRMRYMHYVWHDHLPEAGEMERKIDRLLERWKRVHDRAACSASATQ